MIIKDISDKNLFNQVVRILQNNRDKYDDIRPIANAKVPIIKFIEIDTQINYDISINKLDGIR